jgi:5-oxopent-3-ene-1,2,5-tricarboxylate decarboxylase/2-hydroxyhepta-2,4-diene-1,7-dioate isomerase
VSATHPLGLRPSKIVAVHVNYRSRAAERGRVPAVPSYFLKPPSALSCDGADLVRPQGCELMVFEGEIALVMGKRAYQVRPEGALDHVAGYVAANDAGVLDLREADRGSNVRSKGQDGFCPLGSALIDARDVDPGSLVLRTYVNGELRQDSTGDALLFSFAQLVADLSRTMTLEPDDIVLTGTPAGAGVVEPGDVVEVELVGAGRLRNRVVPAGEPLARYGAMPEATAESRALAHGTVADPPRNPPLAAATERRLGRVATATLSSQLRKRGIDHHAIGGLRPTRPAQRLLGFARTLRYLPLREDVFARIGGAGNAQKQAVETLQPGEVLVIDCRGEPGAGTIGDILALAAIRRGATGIVTDGGLRDVAAVTALDVPAYYGAPHPAVLGRRHVPVDLDLPVACGGALVLPGDVLVGDADGVVVVPRGLADEVAAAAELQEHEETFIAQRVQAGESLAGLYPMDAGRRAEYEAWAAARDGGPGESGAAEGEPS